jgi:hypothetical protein
MKSSSPFALLLPSVDAFEDLLDNVLQFWVIVLPSSSSLHRSMLTYILPE